MKVMREGAMRLHVHEPYLEDLRCAGDWGPGELCVKPDWPCLEEVSVIFLHTDHRVFADVPQATLLAHLPPGDKILDNTGCWAKHREAFAQRGIWYRVIGEPGWTGDTP